MVGIITTNKSIKRRIFLEIILIFFLLHFISLNKNPVYFANTAQGHHLIAKLFIKEGKYVKAKEATDKALALNNKFAKSYLDLGNIYIYLYENDKAERAYFTALKHIKGDSANQAIILQNLGNIYLTYGLADKSWEYYKKSYLIKSYTKPTSWAKEYLAFIPKNDKAGFITYVHKNFRDYNYSEILHIKKILEKELRKKNYPYIKSKSKKYLSEKRYSKYSYLILNVLVTALIENDEIPIADQEIKLFEKKKNNNSKIAFLKHHMAYTLNKNKYYDSALHYSNEIIFKNKGYDDILKVYNLASKIHKTKGNQKKSVSILEEAIRNFPSKKLNSTYALLAAGYSELGKNDLAQKYLIMSETLLSISIGTIVSCLIFSGLIIGFTILISKLFFKKNNLINKKDKNLKLSNLYVFLFLLFSIYILIPLNSLVLQDKLKTFLDILHLDINLFAVLLCQLILAGFCFYSLKKQYKFNNHDLGFYSRGFKFNVILPICLFVVYIIILSIFFTLFYRLIGFESPDSPWKLIFSQTIEKNNPLNMFALFLIICIQL